MWSPYASWAPGPFRSLEERLTTQALQVANVPGAVLQAEVRPPLPQINPFPPRYGYSHGALSIVQILDINRVPRMDSHHQENRDPRRLDYSGTAGEINSAARNVGTDLTGGG